MALKWPLFCVPLRNYSVCILIHSRWQSVTSSIIVAEVILSRDHASRCSQHHGYAVFQLLQNANDPIIVDPFELMRYRSNMDCVMCEEEISVSFWAIRTQKLVVWILAGITSWAHKELGWDMTEENVFFNLHKKKTCLYVTQSTQINPAGSGLGRHQVVGTETWSIMFWY